MSEREQVWRERIEWQPWSGITVAKCCEAAGVSVASFYRWKKLLTEPQGPRRLRSTQRTEMRASGRKKGASQFVPIALRDSSTHPAPPQSIASDHGNSMRIELPKESKRKESKREGGNRKEDILLFCWVTSVNLPLTLRSFTNLDAGIGMLCPHDTSAPA